jgi:ABC-type Mn2+/Zn2+ transport system permease subunit
MLAWLLNPLQYGFMWRSLAAATIVGVVCAVVGTFVVLRGMAFFGDALSHAILPGVAVSYLAGGTQGPLFWGALAAAVLTALGIGKISQNQKLREDTAIGVVFAGALALGIAMMSLVRSYSVDLTHILFGNILAITNSDLLLIGGFGLAVLLTVTAFYKEFVAVAFDPVHAATLRLPIERLRYLLLLLVAVTVVVALQTVGAGLMTAMLITPAATGYLLARKLRHMLTIAILIGVGSGFAGLYLSYYVAVASGAAIVLIATACFVVAWSVTRLSQRQA